MSLFVDTVQIRVKAGNGGNGCVNFHREMFVMNGGPDGGDGGRGGDVIFEVAKNMHTLLDFRYHTKFHAGNGEDGRHNNQSGARGADAVISVPPGTVVYGQDGRVLLDMGAQGRRLLLRGGRGGFGNQHFATPTRQTPAFAKPGMQTEEVVLRLELKTIADVGLVGFPNVGKSTLLSVVTAAKPKIADYHFTTLLPNLGVVRIHEDGFVLADIPGLIEGASAGAGLGHAFLRHVERTRLLVHVLDISGCEGRDPLSDYDIINEELRLYGELQNRPQIIAANKTDLPDAEENLARLRVKLPGTPIYPISAATSQGLSQLMNAVYEKLQTLPPASTFLEEDLQDDEEAQGPPFEIDREDDGAFLVRGPSVAHLIQSVNFGNEDSLQWFQRTLRRMGVIDALRAAGAKEGDTVRIADVAFDFID